MCTRCAQHSVILDNIGADWTDCLDSGPRPQPTPRTGGHSLDADRAAGSERVIRHAFELARRRATAGHEGRVTVGAKTNMLPATDGLFTDVATEYPDIVHETFIVDDLAHYGHDYAYFESAHGTAPDIAGKHVINPTATLLSASMMLDYLGLHDDAVRLERAVDAVYADAAVLTPDQGGRASTEQFAQHVIGALR